MVPFSILDPSPICEGSDPGEALRNSLDLARHADSWGFNRYWLAEHHSHPDVASAATAVVIGQVAAATRSIRVGAGGIILPNHAPLVVAEQFGTLALFFPGRIDLGLGRAPGTDVSTLRALRRDPERAKEDFPQDVGELLGYFEPPLPYRRTRAVPGAGLDVPVWILGASLAGAEVAAARGLPYAFASHFAPAAMREAIELYRSRFQPSARLAAPYVMLGVNVIGAETDAEAGFLFTSLLQAVLRIKSKNRTALPPPVKDFETKLGPRGRALTQQSLYCSVVGSTATLKQGLAEFIAQTGADELIVTAQIFDHAARLRSLEITAAVARELAGG